LSEPAAEPRDWDAVRAAAIDALAEAAEAEFSGAPILPSTAARLTDAILAVLNEEALNRLGAEYVDASRLRALRAEDGHAVLDMVAARDAAAGWVLAARALLDGAENYSETSMEFVDRPRGERYAFTVQRVGKLTPHEARRKAESERDELVRQLAIARGEADCA
jgi:hypothetical protein